MVPPKNLPPSIGQYDVVDLLGEGATSTVYRGRDPRIGRSVAIRLVRIGDEGLRERFLRDARSAAQLQHPNIVTIFEVGEHDGQPFVVMELVLGVTLADYIRSGLQLSLSRKLELLEELSSGLDYAHGLGIVHRDIKPANVMIDRDGLLKILDLGIAEVAEAGPTQAGGLTGTPNYLSPEQILGRPADRRSDIFAVGSLAYELLSYRPAFSGSSLDVAMSIVKGEPAPLRELCPDLDPALEAVVATAMRKDPLKRYQTLTEMSADLERLRVHAGGGTASTDEPTTSIVPPPVVAPAPSPSPLRPVPRDLRLSPSELAKRRLEAIERCLDEAQHGFDAGDFAGAVESCEQALLLDSDEPRVLALLERARQGVEDKHGRLEHIPGDIAVAVADLPTQPGVLDSPASLALDENVQFTVFRPRVLEPAKWSTMLVFAHLSERPPEASAEDPDPNEEVNRQAAALLGDLSDYRQHMEDSVQSVPRDGELLCVPRAEGIVFNPPSRTFRWTESVHREEFRLRAGAGLAGRSAYGSVTIYLGAIVLAEIGMTLKIVARADARPEPPARDSVRPYRKLFASYSHRDKGIVEEFSEYARAVGDRYLQDVIDLRSGEQWQPGLEALIREADVFQLFWSWNAIESRFVQQEWQYAMSLGRRSFVRPVYWNDPLPERDGLPPDVLRQLHFERIRPKGPSSGQDASTSLPIAPAQPQPMPAPLVVTRPRLDEPTTATGLTVGSAASYAEDLSMGRDTTVGSRPSPVAQPQPVELRRGARRGVQSRRPLPRSR